MTARDDLEETQEANWETVRLSRQEILRQPGAGALGLKKSVPISGHSEIIKTTWYTKSSMAE